jgi:LPXTG-site transpeptidase (sortase) family protein
MLSMARLGTVLLVCGVLLLAFGVAWQQGLVPGSRVTLPPPVARAAPTPPPVVAAAAMAATPVPATPVAVPATVLPLPRVAAADAADRAATPGPRGYAVRLAIPAIKLDTAVEQAGIGRDASGNPIWETLPFVAVHYGDTTSPLGVAGNAVIAGHVVTLSEGNVFRFLYQLDLDDEIAVWDQLDREHDYQVAQVRLVKPDDTSVMATTPEETLTLITCGGTFDPVSREFSDRLIVTARPIPSSQPIN